MAGREPHIVRASTALEEVLVLADRVAGGDAKVLITGESGVGKDIVARYIHARSQRATRDGAEITLTAKEYSLLEYMGRHAGRVIGREEIAERVWNEEFDAFSNLIEVYINRLRRAIDRDHERKLIHTVRGAGYRLE